MVKQFKARSSLELSKWHLLLEIRANSQQQTLHNLLLLTPQLLEEKTSDLTQARSLAPMLAAKTSDLTQARSLAPMLAAKTSDKTYKTDRKALLLAGWICHPVVLVLCLEQLMVRNLLV
jgi:hypothetical protein